MARPIITAERLRELLHYDPDTGLFTWRINRRGGANAGDTAGTWTSGGYCQIAVCGRTYRAHRLAFLYMTGEWPPHGVDHKYGIRHDNRWSEIRPATSIENSQNLRTAHAGNKCGLLGVCPDRGRWKAQIRADRKKKFIGRFDTPELAHAAYLEAKAKLHPFQTLVAKTSGSADDLP